jgi:hypothetical protein
MKNHPTIVSRILQFGRDSFGGVSRSNQLLNLP